MPVTRPLRYTPLPIRNPMDSSCLIDGERIQPSHLLGNLESDLAAYPLDWLRKHYPELDFGHEIRGKRPKGKTCVASFRGGWRWANWRTR